MAVGYQYIPRTERIPVKPTTKRIHKDKGPR